jgi:hypothetical protein
VVGAVISPLILSMSARRGKFYFIRRYLKKGRKIVVAMAARPLLNLDGT